MNAKDLKNDIMAWFDGFGEDEACEVHDGLDFEELRAHDNVLAVVVTNIQEANIGLPDYFADVQLILDCRISQEDAEDVYEMLTAELIRKVGELTYRGGDIKDKFPTAPVVGIRQETDFTRSIGADSNITTAVIHFVLSYDLQ